MRASSGFPLRGLPGGDGDRLTGVWGRRWCPAVERKAALVSRWGKETPVADMEIGVGIGVGDFLFLMFDMFGLGILMVMKSVEQCVRVGVG
jgi:hypothetical protein